jgi:uncharacterized protein (UPF0261 family)
MSDTAPTDAPRVAVLATLDTKGPEAHFLVEELSVRGIRPLLVDVALTGFSPADAAVTRAQLAQRGATDASGDDRTTAMETTADAAADVLAELIAADGIAGVIGIGGGTGGWISQRAFEPLPFGFPKVVVTTVVKASGENDIVLIPSVVDVAGLNGLLTTVLRNAAAALAGMVAPAESRAAVAPRPTLAMTMFGVTTAGGDVARGTLEEAGSDVLVFHATGAGGRTMERLISDGRFVGVLDWTTTEITQNLTGGLCDAGPNRLEAAAAAGIPQVIVPGALDVINVLPPIPAEFSDRASHWHLPTVPLVRASADDSARAAWFVAAKLASATGPAAVLIPEGGFSSLDIAGGAFADAAADAAFQSALRDALRSDIPVLTSPLHINDAAFAREAAQTLLAMLPPRSEPTEKE